VIKGKAKRIFARVKDAAGNISNWKKAKLKKK